MLLAALSLWTAIPLGWIYIGSKLSQTQFPSAGPYMIVAVGFVVSEVLAEWLIGRLNWLYTRITGTNRLTPMRPTWLRSIGETSPTARKTSIVEAVMIGSVGLAALVFTVWFFLLAGSPLPNQ